MEVNSNSLHSFHIITEGTDSLEPDTSGMSSIQWKVIRYDEQVALGVFSAILGMSIVISVLWILQLDAWLTCLIALGATVLLSPGLWIVVKSMASGDTEEIIFSRGLLCYHRQFPFYLLKRHDLSMPDYLQLLFGAGGILKVNIDAIQSISILESDGIFELFIILSTGRKIPILHGSDLNQVAQFNRAVSFLLALRIDKCVNSTDASLREVD